jgi:hypothetical protein
MEMFFIAAFAHAAAELVERSGIMKKACSARAGFREHRQE